MATVSSDIEIDIIGIKDKITALEHKVASLGGRVESYTKSVMSPGYDRPFALEAKLSEAHDSLYIARKKLVNLKKIRRTQKKALEDHTVMRKKISEHKERVIKLCDDVRKVWYDSLSDVIIPSSDAPRTEALRILCDGWARLNDWLEYIDCTIEQFSMIQNAVRDDLDADIAEWRETAGLRVY